MNRIIYINNEERTLAMLCHLSALAMFIFPFGNIIGPLLVWLIKRDQYTEVDRQGKNALNFQISITIYTIIALMLVILFIGIPLLVAIGILNIVVIVIASIRSNNGERFEYPFSLKLIN